MEIKTPIIREGFTNSKGDRFDNIHEIACQSKESLFSICGTLVGTSGRTDVDEVEGVLVYRSKIEPDKVYRIYRDQLYYTYYEYRDEYFISELRNYAKDLKLSEVPTGVITLNGKTIGQETPYVGGVTLHEYAANEKNPILPTKIYIQILNIIKELYENGIYYHDIHEKNFKIEDNIVKIIDWENQFVKLGKADKSFERLIFDYLTMTFNHLNNESNFNIENEFTRINDFDDAYEKVLKLETKLIRDGYKKI